MMKKDDSLLTVLKLKEVSIIGLQKWKGHTSP